MPMLAGALVLVTSSVLATRMPVVSPNVDPDLNKPSVLLVTIDTLRADHVGVYGYANARTPNLDALANQGVLFRKTVAPTKLTGPSHASILTGLGPEKHGVFLNNMHLPKSVPTLADTLKDNGYVTGAFVSAYTTRNGTCALPSRFQYYDDEFNPHRIVFREAFSKLLLLRPIMKFFQARGFDFSPAYRGAAQTADLAIEWIKGNGNQPFFLWVHLFDPHLPYRPPAEYLTDADRQYNGTVSGKWYSLDATERGKIVSSIDDMERMIALYDAEIAYADDQVGRLIEAVRNTTTGSNLLIVVTSDHGETMGEHNIFFGRDLYDPTLLVPLIIVMPDAGFQQAREVKEQVRLIDIAPTILAALGLETPNFLDGRSLLDSIAKNIDTSSGPAYSFSNTRSNDFKRRSVSVRTGEWKLIHRSNGWQGGEGSPWVAEIKELYNLRDDPKEKNNIAAFASEQLHELEENLSTHRKQNTVHQLELTDQELDRLRSLGYFR